MSWEALRLTSKTPSEVFQILGPNGVEALVRQAAQRVWDALPMEMRNFGAWEAAARDVFGRNMAVWAGIKKPAPENFFQDLRPEPADGHLRQAMVLCWMMTPMGKRIFAHVKPVIEAIFERVVDAWGADNDTFTFDRSTRQRTAAARLGAPAGAKAGRSAKAAGKAVASGAKVKKPARKAAGAAKSKSKKGRAPAKSTTGKKRRKA